MKANIGRGWWAAAVLPAILLGVSSTFLRPSIAGTPPRNLSASVQLVAQVDDRQEVLEPNASELVVRPGTRLRLDIDTPMVVTATATLTSSAGTKILIDRRVLQPGEVLSAKSETRGVGIETSGLQGTLILDVQLQAAQSPASQRVKWTLRIPDSPSIIAPAVAKLSGSGAKPSVEGALNDVGRDVASTRPPENVLNAMAARVETGAARSRGAAEVELFKRYAPGVVLVVTPDGGLGSGAVVDKTRGLIVTNWHVVGTNETVAVAFKPPRDQDIDDASLYRAVIVGVDARSDLALLQVSSVPRYATELKLGQLSRMKQGADVHAIGHPTGELWTYTKGTVSAVRRDYEWQTEPGTTHRATIIQTQTPINPGNSGGPLLDNTGAIVGINSFKKSGADGLNYAVSVEDIRAFMVQPTKSEADKRTSKASRSGRSADAKPSRRCENKDTAIDVDGDDRADGVSRDEDCDGVAESLVLDANDDGRMDTLYTDLDADGKADVKALDQDGNGTFEVWYFDEDGDGEMDTWGKDLDGDSKPDIYRKIAG